MFYAGDDKLVKCWDLEQNKVIRSYHGHLHLCGFYSLGVIPLLKFCLLEVETLSVGCGTFAAKCKFTHCLDMRIQFVLSSHDLLIRKSYLVLMIQL
ncbi:protein pleiotropic regulatory locus 1 [Phtheirospermum japonicum]|uniref:Protein pleiotropic regulatory locus 1 n=1 Tax=Phtheirospermum japonicum TaxID=374723 RepID=A0A830BVP8_9LAMI|nr:protein pleiotropic regulatory locus 1 [Phtheirospermum japonicum]